MKVAIVYGNQRRGSTYHSVEIFKLRLEQKEKTEFTEFFLPKDMPHFCLGCFNCIYKSEENCPHAASMKPIVEAFDAADGIVLSSPAYVMSVSGGMKALLDHLAFRWMPHRPNSENFQKVGAAVSTVAGMGANQAVKLMKQSLDFWGIKRVYTAPVAVAAKAWEEVKPKTRAKVEKQMEKLADRFYNTYLRREKTGARLKTKFLFSLMRGMHKKNDFNPTDRGHWEKNGWLEGKKPF